jgi:hypothetical protein
MSITLTTVRNQIEIQLSDSSNTIWSEVTLDQAIRSALAELSQIYGSTLFLEGLDGAATTTIEAGDVHVLVMGAVAFALSFRISQRYEEASPVREDIEDLVKAKDKVQELYQDQIYQIKLRKFQESTDHPHTQWEWDEGTEFS